jgi:hypothetical protein
MISKQKNKDVQSVIVSKKEIPETIIISSSPSPSPPAKPKPTVIRSIKVEPRENVKAGMSSEGTKEVLHQHIYQASVLTLQAGYNTNRISVSFLLGRTRG